MKLKEIFKLWFKRIDESFSRESLIKSLTGTTEYEVAIDKLEVVNGVVMPKVSWEDKYPKDIMDNFNDCIEHIRKGV